MSTTYYAICTKCRRAVHLMTRYAGGNVRFDGARRAAPNETDFAAAWIQEHIQCRPDGAAWPVVEIVNEADERLEDFAEDEPGP